MVDHKDVMASLHRQLIKEEKEASEQGGPPFGFETVEAHFSIEENEAIGYGYVIWQLMKELKRSKRIWRG